MKDTPSQITDPGLFLEPAEERAAPDTGFAGLMKAWIGDRSLVAAAEVLHVGVSTLHGYVHGTARPHRRRIPYLAQCMGLPEAQVRAAFEGA